MNNSNNVGNSSALCLNLSKATSLLKEHEDNVFALIKNYSILVSILGIFYCDYMTTMK